MHEALEVVRGLIAAGWKILCVTGVLSLALFLLDRRQKPRVVPQVRRVAERRERRAA